MAHPSPITAKRTSTQVRKEQRENKEREREQRENKKEKEKKEKERRREREEREKREERENLDYEKAYFTPGDTVGSPVDFMGLKSLPLFPLSTHIRFCSVTFCSSHPKILGLRC